MHAQIVSTLTRASVARIFARKQNYDLRRLLAGSERTLDRLLDSVERDPGALLLGAVRCVPSLARCGKHWVPCSDVAQHLAWHCPSWRWVVSW